MTKKIILTFIVIVLTGAIIFFVKNSDKTKITDIKPNNIKNEELSTQDILKEYLKNNISNLSTEKSVLGGIFFITDLKLEDNNVAIVNYEDGHIALKAKFDYSIDKSNNVKIDNFQIIKDDSIVTESHLKCNTHEDCVPLPGCHSHECINKKFIDQYEKPDMCTEMFDFCAAYKDEDCMCQQGTCFNENLMSKDCNK